MRAKFASNTAFYKPGTLDPTIPKFGGIPGIKVGATFEDRVQLSRAGVHTERVAGISGSVRDGAYSVVLSGGYEDDLDEGETFTYTGTGGRNTDGSFGGTQDQTEDQTFSHGDNMALKISSQTGKRVRVVRGFGGDPRYAPPAGYRYDGLYTVESAYYGKGKSGYRVCKFEFSRVPGQPAL